MSKSRIVAFLSFTTAEKLPRMKELWSGRARGPYEKGNETELSRGSRCRAVSRARGPYEKGTETCETERRDIVNPIAARGPYEKATEITTTFQSPSHRCRI